VELYARIFSHLKGSAVYGASARGLIIKTLNELS
jgi:glucan biosynthesis protein